MRSDLGVFGNEIVFSSEHIVFAHISGFDMCVINHPEGEGSKLL